MTDIEILRLIAWPSFFAMLAATFITTLPLAGANGERPLVICLVALSLVMLFISFGALFQAYNLERINSTGFAYVFTFSVRLVGLPVGLLLIKAGLHIRIWRRHR